MIYDLLKNGIQDSNRMETQRLFYSARSPACWGGLSVQDGDPKVSSWASFKAHEGNSRVDDFYLNLLRPQACLKFLKFLNEMCIYFLTFCSRFLGSGVLLTGERENLVISFTISQASCKISCLGDLYPDIKGVNSLLKIVKPPHQPQKEGKQ